MANDVNEVQPKRLRRLPWPARFFARVPLPVGDECMEWTGQISAYGYGIANWPTYIRPAGKHQQPAHRVMYQLLHGPIPDHMQVCHRCDNPPCVRPDHLFLGTAKDNARDRDTKGRHTPPVFHGDDHPHRKVKSSERRALARSHQRFGGPDGTAELARRYGVSNTTVYDILREEMANAG